VALQVVDVTGLGLLLPREMVQSALAPVIHADVDGRVVVDDFG
jgi:hypothetical protein